MNNIQKTVETFHPLLYTIKENFEDKKNIKEKYENDDNNSISIISVIIGILAFILSIYLWIGFHYDNKYESGIYKFMNFIVAFFSNILYIIFNLIFDTKNTIDISKQLLEFKIPPVLNEYKNI